jgi:ribosomal protein L35
MKRGLARTNVYSKTPTHKATKRRVKVTGCGALVHRNRMKKHLMLRRKVEKLRNNLMHGPEERMIKRVLGLSVTNSIRRSK